MAAVEVVRHKTNLMKNKNFTPLLRYAFICLLTIAGFMHKNLQAQCAITTTDFSYSANTTTAIISNAVVQSTITVAGAGPLIADMTVVTDITHTFSGDLDIVLVSPAGTIVTLTTDNCAGNDNVFNGTVWDDDANPGGQVPYTTNPGLVTDHVYANNVLASPLAPEEPLAAFN